ncbi:hypothetical protein IJ847_00860 [Candidatus Saccharibacteria bacterium]|nr:hypothetical protein [Candidatus Saccharibacteria bacterium]
MNDSSLWIQLAVYAALVIVGSFFFASGVIFAKNKTQTKTRILVAFIAFILSLVAQVAYGAIVTSLQEPCTVETQTAWSNLKFVPHGSDVPADYPVICTELVRPASGGDAELYDVYGRNAAGCAMSEIAVADSSICQQKRYTLNEVVTTVINHVIYCIGIISVAMFILAIVALITKKHDETIRKKAKTALIWSIGLFVLAIFLYAVANFSIGCADCQ